MWKGREVQGGNPGMDTSTAAGEEIVPKIVYGLWWWELGGGRHPVEHTNWRICMIVPTFMLGRGECQWGSGTWLGGYYCKWRASVPCSTSSKMWHSWYLPRFLFLGGSLTLMNIASLMVLVKPCCSQPTVEKLSNVVLCPVVWKWSKMI